MSQHPRHKPCVAPATASVSVVPIYTGTCTSPRKATCSKFSTVHSSATLSVCRCSQTLSTPSNDIMAFALSTRASSSVVTAKTSRRVMVARAALLTDVKVSNVGHVERNRAFDKRSACFRLSAARKKRVDNAYDTSPCSCAPRNGCGSRMCMCGCCKLMLSCGNSISHDHCETLARTRAMHVKFCFSADCQKVCSPAAGAQGSQGWL